MFKCKVHPGFILEESLEEFEITPTEFARQIGVPASRISEIINGKRAITTDTAMRFGHWFGTDVRFWTNLQANFDIVVADEQFGSAIRKLPINGSLSERVQGDQMISA